MFLLASLLWISHPVKASNINTLAKMSGPGPSTQANAAARKLRAAEDKKRREAEDSEVGDSEDEDDSELDKDGNEKQPVYHWQIWRKLLREGSMRRKGSRDGLLRYGSLLQRFLKNQAN